MRAGEGEQFFYAEAMVGVPGVLPAKVHFQLIQQVRVHFQHLFHLLAHAAPGLATKACYVLLSRIPSRSLENAFLCSAKQLPSVTRYTYTKYVIFGSSNPSTLLKFGGLPVTSAHQGAKLGRLRRSRNKFSEASRWSTMPFLEYSR